MFLQICGNNKKIGPSGHASAAGQYKIGASIDGQERNMTIKNSGV
jgi:hypothetical protein